MYALQDFVHPLLDQVVDLLQSLQNFPLFQGFLVLLLEQPVDLGVFPLEVLQGLEPFVVEVPLGVLDLLALLLDQFEIVFLQSVQN
jgi:hypothetical protein